MTNVAKNSEGTIVTERAALAESTMLPELDPFTALSRDLKAAAATLSPDEARFLVDTYYIWQEQRKRGSNQIRALEESGEPHEILGWLSGNARAFEKNCKVMLDSYTDEHEVGRWAKSIRGIGPVISAGLLAHIDIERAPTVGHIWSFAGLNPTVKWEKKQKRPWNADLRTLCWKIGESFVKQSGNADCLYGQAWRERKDQEEARNAAGEFEEQAAKALDEKTYRHETDAYKAYEKGMLPPAHIHARSKRWAVKLFLSHWHHVAFTVRYGKEPPKPYILNQPNHTHYLAPPNWPMT